MSLSPPEHPPPHRAALVTGGARRIGRAICLALADAGFSVAVHHHRSIEAAQDTAADCQKLGVDAFVVQGDLTDPTQCWAVADTVCARWPHLDVFVHSAGGFERRAFRDITLADWEQMHALHTRAPFLLAQRLLSHLEAAPNGGVVIHLSDIGARRPLGGAAHYAVSKAGLDMLTRAMAIELAPKVRTCAVAPGHVPCPDDPLPGEDDVPIGRIPMKRGGRASEIAAVVRFLATDGTFINGAVVPVDGGRSARY